MTPLISLVCLVSLTASCQKSAPAKGGALLSVEDALAEYRSATLGYLRFLEGRLEMKTKLRRKGIASDDEVDFYSFNAALERCILARVDGDSEATLKQYKAVIAVRQSQLERTRRLHERGGGMDAEMDLIQRQLASAKYRLAREEGNTENVTKELEHVLEIGDNELRRERGLLGRTAGTQTEVEDAAYRISFAQYLLARAKGNDQERKKRLRETAVLTEASFTRLKDLERRGASSEEEVDWAHLRHLHAQQRLADEEERVQEVRDLQDRLANLTTKMHQRALKSSIATEEEREFLKVERALEQYRRVQAQHGKIIEYESVWELEGRTFIPHQPRG